MSSRELHLHYALYSAIRHAGLGLEVNVLAKLDRERLRAFIPFNGNPGLIQALGFNASHFAFAAAGLDREGMFEDRWGFGPEFRGTTEEDEKS